MSHPSCISSPSCPYTLPSSPLAPLQYQAVALGLSDPHPYVREAAVIGVLKCWHLDTAGVRLHGLIERVEALLMGDPDAQVVANCLYVMQQVGDMCAWGERCVVI
jgi:vesicle coat complex subunit